MSRLVDNAMIDDNGQVFLPDSPGDALYLYAMHGARPAALDRFPWRCPETRRMWAHSGPRASENMAINVQCVLVDQHDGECRSEVSW